MGSIKRRWKFAPSPIKITDLLLLSEDCLKHDDFSRACQFIVLDPHKIVRASITLKADSLQKAQTLQELDR
jgi:hypothetical protein